MNGVQKFASAVISPTKRKIGGAIFHFASLILRTGR
ncbi:hydrolase [Enterococcus faecium]|nr:hydrolase [Enterococcus faecium]